MGPRFAWFVLAALLTAPSVAAGDEPDAGNPEDLRVELDWEARSERDHTYRVYRDGALVHTTSVTSYTDILPSDSRTGLFHAHYEVTVQESGEDHEEFLHGHLVAGSTASWPLCAPLLIATNFTVFPHVFAGINYSCIPPLPPAGGIPGSDVVEEIDGDITFRLFHR